MDLDHEDPRSEWRVDWHCSGCPTTGAVFLSGDHIRCNSPGGYTTVSPLICSVCGKNADIYSESIVCLSTGKRSPREEEVWNDRENTGTWIKFPLVVRATSEKELLDFEKAISKRSPIERAPVVVELLNFERLPS